MLVFRIFVPARLVLVPGERLYRSSTRFGRHIRMRSIFSCTSQLKYSRTKATTFVSAQMVKPSCSSGLCNTEALLVDYEEHLSPTVLPMRVSRDNTRDRRNYICYVQLGSTHAKILLYPSAMYMLNNNLNNTPHSLTIANTGPKASLILLDYIVYT